MNAQTEKMPDRPDLAGTVQTTNGQPVKAAVFISTAGPKVGTSPFCPSCYPDCRKSGRTDNDGNFKIESLDPQLQFRILVVGEGCEPKFVGEVDPAKGPIKVSLKPRDPAEMPLEKLVLGRVIDPRGAPIEGAVVETFRIHYKNGGGWLGENQDTDSLAVSGAHGEFVLASRKDFKSLDLKVSARGFARKRFADVAAGGPSHDLQLTEGAAIQGRVAFNGKPLPNISVGVISEDRSVENSTAHFEVGTDAEGRFLFPNLPPNVRYQVYALMDTVKAYGATKSTVVDAGGDGSVTNAGDFTVSPANKISGRVILSDGNATPAKTRIVIGREDAWDSQIVEVEKDGSFKLEGIPSATMSLSVSVPGYNLSVKNGSLDPINPIRLVGHVDRDIANLVILLDKGAPARPSGGFAEGQLLQTDPLRGAGGPARVAPNDGDSAMTKLFGSSGVLLGDQTGSKKSDFVIEVTVPKSGDAQTEWVTPNWSESINARRRTLTRGLEPAESDTTGFPTASLAGSDFAKYLSNPPWIKEMIYARWQAQSSGGRPGTVETAKWILGTNLAAVQPNGFFAQELTVAPDGYWSVPGGTSITGMSQEHYWRANYLRANDLELHQIFVSPRSPNEGASKDNNPQAIAGMREGVVERIRHFGFPALRPNSFHFQDDRQFSATTRDGDAIRGRILTAEAQRPIALTYIVGNDTTNVFRVDYRYRPNGTLPSYIEAGVKAKDGAGQNPGPGTMASITKVEYGLDPHGSTGYEPAQFFPDMKVFTDIQVWTNGERFSLARDGRMVKIDR